MIHLIEGRSGSGKTEYLCSVLSKLAENGSERLLYLIPEQSSFDCETEFLRRLGPRLCRNIGVMSFTRLYHLVMSRTGGVPGTPIDDDARKILMSVTLEDCADSLTLYARQAAKPQFTQTALSAVKEFKQCGILPDDVRRKGREAGGELENKLSELALIYELFNANVSLSGVDPYDNDMRLEQRIAETRFFEGYTIAVDDFSGFTAQQYKILSLMMEQADDFYISLCTEPFGTDELFSTVNRTKARITEYAGGARLKIASPVRLSENFRTSSEPLLAVEENIYRAAQTDEHPDPEGAVKVVQASDVYDECEYVAAQVCELALSGVCRWRDIAVVLRDPEKYSGVLDEAFERCDIPYFMSKPQPVEAKPLMRLAVSALSFALDPNDESLLLDAAKTGLFAIPDHEIAQLENYIFVWGLKGRSLFSELSMHPDGFSDSFSDDDKRRLAEINDARERVTAPFSALLERVNAANRFTARDISSALYEFMVAAGVPELLKSRAERRLVFSDEGVRLWDTLTQILNKMHVSLGSRRITLRRYTDLFKMVLSGTDISDIPQTLDQVLVGKADSVRLSKPYAVFVIGAVSGEFPHVPVADGVFSDAERQRLISLGMPLYDCLEDLFRQERFLVYNAVSAPTGRLIVSYPRSDLRGGSAEPSSIITELLRIFPELPVTRTSSLDALSRVTNERTAFEQYARGYRSKTPFQAALGEYLRDSFDYGERVSYLGRTIKNTDVKLADRDVSAALFGRDKHLSASQIEAFYECRFKYLLNYGLRIRERRRAQLDSLLYGTLLHYILENVIRAYISRTGAPFTDDELTQLLESLMKKYMDEELGGAEGKTDRFMFMYERSKERVLRVLKHMTEELSQSGFTPVDTELDVGMSGMGIPEYTVMTDKGETVYINGKIDRVDMMDCENGSAFVRIIDYKTNGRTFSLEEVLNGLNLQMLIYMAAVAKNGEARYRRPVEPAAVLYMRAQLGIVSVKNEGKKTKEKEAEDEAGKQLSMTGVSVDTEQVVKGMGEKSGFVNAEKITAQQLSMIFDYVDKMILRMNSALDGGDASASPVNNVKAKKTSCEYCDYKPICRREESDGYKLITGEKSETTLEKMHGETEGKNNE